MVTVKVSDLRLGVRREVAPLAALLVKRLEKARDMKFGPSTSFGFACRAIAGTQTPSNHSFGLALDLDAPENPQLTAEQHRQPHSLRKTFPGGRVLRSTMPLETEAIAQKLAFGGAGFLSPNPIQCTSSSLARWPTPKGWARS